MAFEIITLNLIPDGTMPVYHSSQFDIDRPIIIDLVMGEDVYVVPEGISVELHCRKVDDNIVTMEPDEISENRVTFVTTEQLTACIGDNLCEVAILSGTSHIGTLNFILHVEPDPLAGGLTSESEIYNLTQQIEDIAHEVIGEDYYDKSEVDGLLADKADKSELPDMDDYYTKSEADTLLSDKADKSDTYTKDQVDLMLFNMLPVGTASGSIATFETALSDNVVELTAEINPVQSGSGTPSPVNPRPISGFTECNITNTDNVDVTNVVTVAFGQTVYGGVLTCKNGAWKVTSTLTIVNDMSLLNWQYNSVVGNFYCELTEIAKTVGDNYLTFKLCSMLELVDGSVGSVNHAIQYYNNYLRMRVEEYSDVANLKTALTGAQLVYELATPIEIDLTAEQVETLVGLNNVFHDCNGNISVSYKDTIQHYIDTRL